MELGVVSTPTTDEIRDARAFGLRFSMILREHIDSLTEDPPNTLYHYTTAAGLKSILENGVIWASHFAYLNDPAEIREGSDLIRKALYASSSRLANEAAGKLFNPAVRLRTQRDTYLASFSESGDDLPQWLLYADGGRGFSIGFDLKRVESRLAKVIYERSEFDERMEDLLKAAEEIWQHEKRSTSLRNLNPDLARTYCASRLLSISEWACRYKTPSWKHEKEWRLLPDFYTKVPVRVRGSVLVPYTEVQLWEKPADPEELTPVPIKEIILGPLQDWQTGASAVRMLWRHLRLKRRVARSSSIGARVQSPVPRVKQSTIEYRQV